MPRLLITADLHYNHAKSRALADDIINAMNRAGGDGILIVGDTAAFDDDALEQCLSRIAVPGPRLFIAGNHELWTRGADSYANYRERLPARLAGIGWTFLEDAPQTFGDAAIVGSVGWYDYSFAPESLGIPKRFYAAKLSPGVAERLDEHRHLLDDRSDVSEHALDVIARWNDGKFVKLGRTDEQFLDELVERLRSQLDSLARCAKVIAAVHHLPFRELLPPPHNAQWDFAKAYLGSARIGELLLKYPNVDRVYSGHSHFPAEAQVGHIRAINVGSGYRNKTFLTLDV